MAPPGPQSHDESGGDSMDLEDASRLWPTFAALFLLTLLYSGFVTFLKVRQPAPLCARLGDTLGLAQGAHGQQGVYTVIRGHGTGPGLSALRQQRPPPTGLRPPPVETDAGRLLTSDSTGRTRGPGAWPLGTLPLTPAPFLTPGSYCR